MSRLGRWCCVMLGLSAVGCGAHTPLAPDPTSTATSVTASIPSNLRGVWHGYINGTSCLSSNPCEKDPMHPFTLRVVESAGGFAGSLEIQEGFDSRTVLVDLTGLSQSDGFVNFTGSRNAIFYTNVAVNRFRVRTDAASGLVGDVDVFVTSNSGQTGALTGTVISAYYQPLETASLAGSWNGAATIRTCDSGCGFEYVPGADTRIYVIFDGAGAGSLRDDGLIGGVLQFTGTEGANSFSVSTPLIQYPDGGSLRLEQFSGTIDSLGRISLSSIVLSGARSAHASLPGPIRMTLEVKWLVRK